MIFQGRLMSVLGSFRSASNRSQGILKKFNCFKQFSICFNEVLGVLQDCLKEISMKFKERFEWFNNVLRLFQGGFKQVSRVCQDCLKASLRKFQRCLKRVLRVFLESFRGVFMFQGNLILYFCCCMAVLI